MSRWTPERVALQHEIEELLYREAWLVDTRRWQEWLALFTEDVEFWVPAWASEDALATDPRTQLSLIHMTGRDGLDDRVWRIGTRDSYASTPLPRSCHVVGNVLVLDWEAEEVPVAASWTVHLYHARKGPRTWGGRYKYRLRRTEDGLRIAAKTVIFLEDAVDVPIDVYNI